MVQICQPEKNVKVGSVKTLTESLAILMATYYVFDIEYPSSELSKTLTFFQKVILKRSESGKNFCEGNRSDIAY